MKKLFALALIIHMTLASVSHAIETEAGDIHGFLSQGYLQSDENNFLADTKDGTFQFREMGINFRATLTPSLSAGFQVFARDIGDMGNNEGEVDWAYVDYSYRKWLGLRAGKIKTPFGLYNDTRDIDMARVSVLLPQGVYNEGWRDSFKSKTGLEFYGRIPLNKLGNVSYQVQAGEMDMDTDGGIAKFTNAQADVTINDINLETSYTASLKWDTPLDGLRFGMSGNKFDYENEFTTNDGYFWRKKTVDAVLGDLAESGITEAMFPGVFGMAPTYENITGPLAGVFGVDLVNLPVEMPLKNIYWTFSLEYIWNDLTLAAEYAKMKVDYEMESELYGLLDDKQFFFYGYYYSAAYRFTDWFELGTYYSVFYPDARDKSGTFTAAEFGVPKEINWSKDICVSTRFDLSDNWVFKLEAHSMDGLAVMYLLDQDTNPDGSMDVETDGWYLLAAKVTYSF